MRNQGKPRPISVPQQPSPPWSPSANGHVDVRGLTVPPPIKYLIRHGDTIGQYPSHAEALSAVLSALASAGYDNDHIARLCLLEEHGISDLPREKGRAWLENELQQARRKAYSLARQAEGEPEDAVDLRIDTIQPAVPVVEDLLYEGMLLFGGKSKRGKSWLMLDLAVSVATGNPVWRHFPVPKPQPVLYISLEDGRRRIKGRLENIPPEVRQRGYLQFLYNFPMLDQGGMEKLQGYIRNGRYRLIIIDVLARIEPQGKRSSEKTYLEIYDMFAPLQNLHREHPTCLAMVTHLRKADAEDIFDTLHGSVGYQGIQDALWVMERPPQNKVAVIHTRPNEGEEQVLHVAFVDGHWEFQGHDEEIRSIRLSEDIRELYEETSKPLSIAAMDKALSGPRNRYHSIKKTVYRMMEKGLMVRVGRGQYIPTGHADKNN